MLIDLLLLIVALIAIDILWWRPLNRESIDRMTKEIETWKR